MQATEDVMASYFSKSDSAPSGKDGLPALQNEEAMVCDSHLVAIAECLRSPDGIGACVEQVCRTVQLAFDSRFGPESFSARQLSRLTAQLRADETPRQTLETAFRITELLNAVSDKERRRAGLAFEREREFRPSTY